MSMTSILQIFKLNEPRKGEKNGRAWEMQDAECAVLTDDGKVDQVAVLVIPKDLMGKVSPGVFLGRFALKADTSREGQRRLQAVLVGLDPYTVKGAK